MRRTVRRRSSDNDLPATVVAALAVLAVVVLALLATSQTASAYVAYQHGGIDDCETCHENAHTKRMPGNFACFTCHSGYQIVRDGEYCWTCHTPGEDMRWARTDASCLDTCHLRGGPGTYDVPFTHTRHADGSDACTSCHPLTSSPAESAGSAHHTIPAPRLDLVTPSAAAPGATVTLTGAKLSWTAMVRFGGAEAAFTVLSDTALSATVPETAATGTVTVLSGGGLATSAAAFVVLRPEPPLPPRLTLSVSRRVVAVRGRVRLAGKLAPSGAATAVRVTVRRRVAGGWKTMANASRPLDSDGKFTWQYRPRRAGAYKARALAGGVASAWVSFRVR